MKTQNLRLKNDVIDSKTTRAYSSNDEIKFLTNFIRIKSL